MSTSKRIRLGSLQLVLGIGVFIYAAVSHPTQSAVPDVGWVAITFLALGFLSIAEGLLP